MLTGIYNRKTGDGHALHKKGYCWGNTENIWKI